MERSSGRIPTRFVALVAFVALAALLILPAEAFAAVRVSKASLSAGSLRVEGQGALASATITVSSPESTATGRADSKGEFKISASNYRSSTCKVTVRDASSSVVATLSGCTVAPVPPPPAPPPSPTAPALSFVALSHTSLAAVGTIAIGEVRLVSVTSTAVAVTVTSSHPAIARVTLGTTTEVSSVQVEPGFDQAVFNVRHVAAVTAPTLVTITAAANGVTKTTTLTINPDPGVIISADGPLGPGFVGSDFVTFATLGTVIALGGPALGPVSWGVTAGQLPAGLRLADVNTSGTPAKHTWVAVVGTPTTVGTSTFSVRLTDANGVSRTGNYSITVNPALGLVINPQLPWSLSVGVFTNLWLDGSGGVQPFTWTRTAGAFPPGMSLVSNSTGTLVRVTGTPTTAGTYSFTLRLTDSTGATTTGTFTVTVN